MAGQPELSDQRNVNNWHWVEKNATPWSKDRLTALLIGQKIEKGFLSITLEEFKKIEGDATANNRKAKLIFLFDWVIEIKFNANVSGSDVEYKGILDIPNLSDENEADEVDLNVTVETRGPHEAEIRHVLATDGLKFIRAQLGTYIRELKEEFSQGIILPTSKPQVVVKSGKTTVVDKRSFQNEVVTDGTAKLNLGPVEITSFEIQSDFKVPPSRLYEMLTSAELVSAWTNGKAEVNAKIGGTFTLYNGQITGEFTKLVVDKEISTKWRLREYPAGHYAEIKFVLVDQRDSTKLSLSASNVPKQLAENTESGFKRFYFQNIGRTFGCGMQIF